MKKILLRTLRYILYFIGFVALYLAAAFTVPNIEVNADCLKCENGIDIYILSNGVHTDIVMPAKNDIYDWSKKLRYSDFEEVDSSYGYIAMGWGDKGFYIGTPTWDDLKFSTAFKAAFGLSTTAMHVSYRHYAPRTGELCKKIKISETQYKLLVAYCSGWFQRKEGMFIPITHPGYSLQDNFYEAEGTYSLFRTCNVWTNDGLKVIGRKAAVWAPFHRGVLDHCE
jgi:uncharacterized protein (TIGR02117 family)